MSPRRIRLEARLFRGESVTFEACTQFRPVDEPSLCSCGWLADDHGMPAPAAPAANLAAVRQLRRAAPASGVPARRAS